MDHVLVCNCVRLIDVDYCAVTSASAAQGSTAVLATLAALATANNEGTSQEQSKY